MDKKLLGHELKRLEEEARLQSKGQRPALALLRLSSSIRSLLKSLEDDRLPSSSLSAREHEVLSLVAQGFTNREIASALSITEKTIEYHLKSLFTKTEATTRTEAVKNAFKNGWLE